MSAKHKFIEVSRRRWCVGRDLYQNLAPGREWREPNSDCPRYTAYAVSQDARGPRREIGSNDQDDELGMAWWNALTKAMSAR